MTKQEQIEQAEKAIEIHQKSIKNSEESIAIDERLIKEWQQKLSDLKKHPEPKEGEWWYWENSNGENAGVIKNTIGNNPKYYFYSEYYCKTSGGLRSDIIPKEQDVFRPATTEEITYFMGLHADRLGIKEGVTVDRSKLSHKNLVSSKVAELSSNDYLFTCSCFFVDGCLVRDENGDWATVVDEPKPVKNGKLKAKIAELETENEQLKERLNKITDLCKIEK